MNNEQIGISAEIAIADFFNVPISSDYRLRGIPCVADTFSEIIKTVFYDNNIPKPVKHVAEHQSDVDFLLDYGKTLSVKTNKQGLGKAAPQKVGQASSKTWFSLMASKLNITKIPSTYQEKVVIFKELVYSKIDELLKIYWENMFECDYFIQFYNVVDANDNLTLSPKAIIMKKHKSPYWDRSKIRFTKSSIAEWNESNTVKYGHQGISIGEFQVHNNRDNFKFRFNMAGIERILKSGELHIDN